MPVTLSVLFTTPQDIWDVLSVEGVDLRQDDSSRASGQVIEVAADASASGTSLTTVATPVALLRGAELTFDLAGMSVPVTVQLSAAAVVGSTTLNVATLSADVPSGAQARDSGLNAATGARLLVAARKGTSKVKLYCNQRYDDSQLVLSGSVLDWATTVACRWLCTRRAQSSPKGIEAEYKEVVSILQMVQSGQLSVEDIGTRGVDWPTIVNVTVNPAYDVARTRVQAAISEGTPTAYPQFIDWNSALLL